MTPHLIARLRQLIDKHLPALSPQTRRAKVVRVLDQKLTDALRPIDEKTRKEILSAWEVALEAVRRPDDNGALPNPGRLLAQSMDRIKKVCCSGLRKRFEEATRVTLAFMEKASREIDPVLVQAAKDVVRQHFAIDHLYCQTAKQSPDVFLRHNVPIDESGNRMIEYKLSLIAVHELNYSRETTASIERELDELLQSYPGFWRSGWLYIRHNFWKVAVPAVIGAAVLQFF
jgi:hypothetical protein